MWGRHHLNPGLWCSRGCPVFVGWKRRVWVSAGRGRCRVPHVWEAPINSLPNQVGRLQGNSFPAVTSLSPGRSSPWEGSHCKASLGGILQDAD